MPEGKQAASISDFHESLTDEGDRVAIQVLSFREFGSGLLTTATR